MVPSRLDAKRIRLTAARVASGVGVAGCGVGVGGATVASGVAVTAVVGRTASDAGVVDATGGEDATQPACMTTTKQINRKLDLDISLLLVKPPKAVST
jgi:hypothetical protein